MANERHLLVPIKAQALVIDDIVIDRSGAALVDGKYVANAGRWSPLQSDYQSVPGSLSAPGPIPFYGATRKYQGKDADQLVLDANSRALPKPKDRGVYLHWVLPSGLRHAYKPSSLDFPALPDQWLIVRFCRRGAALQTKAWFVDSGLVVDSDDDPANLLLEGGDEYEARRVGKVVPLDEFAPAGFAGQRSTITAIGNAQTGSPTFTAFLAENRNVLSWHDTLNDLREPVNTGKVPKDTSISYLLLGWYRDRESEPLKALPVELVKQESPKPDGWLIEPLGWLVESAQAPGDLKSHRSLFHGMVAHINYWSSNTYKGPMLGYPGSPAVAGTLGGSPPAFKVGVGNNAEDALVSLVSSEYSGAETAPNLWKALEAVIYRQPESLVGSWNAAPRDHTVHQSWFSTLEAGKTWSIRPRSRNESTFPADPKVTAAQTGTSATPEQLAALKHLNKLQSESDAASRELVALQQDLYARWWKLCERSRLNEAASLKDEEADCRALIARVTTLRSHRDALIAQLHPLPDALKKKLPAELELRSDDAPRFWAPADPVIVVMNCGRPAKHQFPNPLPCRLPEQIVSAGEVEVSKNQKKTFDTASGTTEIASLVQKHFGEHSAILTSLLTEGSLVEQAITDLAHRSYEALPPDDRVFDAGGWRKWTNRLVDDLNWDGQSNSLPTDKVRFGKPDALNIQPHRLVELWVQQPWSPLFLDWQITWFPSTQSGQDFGPVWSLGEHGYDYHPRNRESLPTKGFTFRGRSLLNPIDGRLFDEPLETLRQLLRGGDEESDSGKPLFPPAVMEILKNYKGVWDETLRKLSGAGLMGQALTGLHQSLIRRDVTLPRVMPDPKHPWVFRSRLKDLELEVGRLLDASIEGSLAGERLAPPGLPPPTAELSFTMVRAGALRLDELWLVDDFGQWADLLGLTSSGSTSSGQVFNPRMRWHEDPSFVAMPPRVIQPARLNFRFTAAENSVVESDSDPSLSPICGWICYNPLDETLVLCDRDGRLEGELVITTGQTGFRVDWDRGARGVALADIRNPTLQTFAESLVETTWSPKPRLLDLLTLIDRALERIRPAAARRDGALFGRPLALVSAHLGLELFGKSWTDPRKTPVAAPLENAGDATLNALRVRVNLGCAHNTEDGLIGYFIAGDYDRIVPTQLAKKIDSTGYIADSQTAALRVGFGAPEQLTLLMDPWGSVQAAAGLVPAKSITLAQANLDRTLAQMEASFRVGPVLLQADRLALPTPAGDKGRWSFSGPLTNNQAASLAPSDPRYFSDQPVVAAEGRLLLLNKEE
jgi:hypothetical protein